MVLGSCYSFQGKSHKISNTVCQDASLVKEIVGDWTVMATADGVGTCSKADVGAKTAVEVATSLCVEAFPLDGNDKAIISVLRTAFNRAMRAIYQIAKENDEDITNYDTTLDIVIFNGTNKLYYGHVGDGGIYVLNGDGKYTEITSVQEGEEASSVCPLRIGNESWEFGIYEAEIAVVAIFTDGIRDKISSSLLRNEKCKIDVPLANKFMFIDVYGMTEVEAKEVISESMQKSAEYLHSNSCKITDDVTMGILVNTSVFIKQDPMEIYEKPDWLRIWSEVIERLYPSYDSVKQIGRRHILSKYITENPEKANVPNEQLEQALDKYYPLTPENKEEYNKKYCDNTIIKDTSKNIQTEVHETCEEVEQLEKSYSKISYIKQKIESILGENKTNSKDLETTKLSEDTSLPIVDKIELSSTSEQYNSELESITQANQNISEQKYNMNKSKNIKEIQDLSIPLDKTKE